MLGACLGFGQGATGTISGVVRDGTGGVIPGATVTVKHTESGLTRTVNTAEDGTFRIPSLPVGAYEVTAEKLGFTQQVRRGINLVVAQEAVVNLTLEVGNVAEQITVTEEAPLVNTTLSPTSGLVNEGQIKDLPLNGRSFDQLLTLNTGAVNFTSNVGQGRGGNFFSVVGRRPEENAFMINGVEYLGSNNAGQPAGPYGVSGETLGVDAVREFNVLEHSYGAEYGKRAGGQVTIVTSSGTNQLHGSVFEYLRNSALDARNFFDATIGAPPFKRNQFGGSLGGPLKKNKAFLFGNYEGFRQRLAVSNVAVVPNMQARQGFLPCNVVTSTPTFAKPSCSGSQLINVNTAPGMLSFANYFWPAPNGKELLVNGLPSGTAYAISNPPQAIREDFGLTRFDHNLSAKDSFSANYLIDDGDRTDPRTDTNFTQVSQVRSQVLSLQQTHVVSPTVLNSANFGFTRAYALVGTPPAVPFPANLSFISGRVPGQITIGGGVSTTAASAIVVANGNTAVQNALNLFSGSDDVHVTKGKHSLSAGVWVQRVQQNQSGPAQNIAGTAAYSTLQAFLQDSPTAFNANVKVTPVGYRQFEAAWYVQDEVKLKPNLTLRLGLRDEMTNGWNEVAGRCSNLLYDKNSVVLSDPLVGHSCFTKNNAKALFQPRVGLAWDPTGTGTWAIRAAFGIHNDLQDNLAFRLDSNPPFNGRITIQGRPMLSIIPISPDLPLPPTCNAQLVAAKQNCSIYSVGGVDPAMHTPTVQEWSLTVERGITRDLMVQIGYVGSEAYHTMVPVSLNAPYPVVCTDARGCSSGGVKRPVVTVPQGTLYVPPGPRPNPFVDKTNSQMFSATMSYNALNVSLIKRATRGLTFKTNYTFSKAIDYNSAGSSSSAVNQPKAILNPYNLKLSRGLAAFNMTHQFNANFSYQLPFGPGQRWASRSGKWVEQLVGSWQWNGIVNAQSGFPFTPQMGANTSGTGDTDNPDVPNFNPAFRGPVILGKPDHWFNPDAFLPPLSGTFGNVARGAFLGPGLFTVDTSLFKKIAINENWSLQFRAEGFNVLNHTNFASPNPIVFSGNSISSSAGVITATATTSRQLQFALKLLF